MRLRPFQPDIQRKRAAFRPKAARLRPARPIWEAHPLRGKRPPAGRSRRRRPVNGPEWRGGAKRMARRRSLRFGGPRQAASVRGRRRRRGGPTGLDTFIHARA